MAHEKAVAKKKTKDEPENAEVERQVRRRLYDNLRGLAVEEKFDVVDEDGKACEERVREHVVKNMQNPKAPSPILQKRNRKSATTTHFLWTQHSSSRHLELLLALLQRALYLRLAVREALELRLVFHLAEQR